MSTVVFLGGGRITSAMLAGLRLGKSRHRLLVHDRHRAKLRTLKKKYGVETESNLKRAVAQSDLLIVAVRPDSVRELLQAIGDVERPLPAVSLAAGIPLLLLKKWLGPPVRWVRAMPSPVCRVRCGLTALAFSRGISRPDFVRIGRFFAELGAVTHVPESKFDAFTVTYSPSHGYHALAALAEAGQRAGLDREISLLAAAHALGESIVAWSKSKESLPSLLREAATPGGIAATTMNAMNAAGYGTAVEQGVQAGLRRARANARK